MREVRVAPLVERALAEQGQADDAAAGSSGSSSASYAQVSFAAPNHPLHPSMLPLSMRVPFCANLLSSHPLIRDSEHCQGAGKGGY